MRGYSQLRSCDSLTAAELLDSGETFGQKIPEHLQTPRFAVDISRAFGAAGIGMGQVVQGLAQYREFVRVVPPEFGSCAVL